MTAYKREDVTTMVDNKALGRLLAAKQTLTRQQYKTLKGQILAGNADGAMRGLAKLTSREVKA